MPTYPDVKTDIVNGLTETDGNQINNIEDYLGIRTDTEPTCITYKLTNPLSVGPGHKHPVADLDGGSDGTMAFKDPSDHSWKAWLPDTIGLITKLGEQTISAKKTFSVLPECNVVPTSGVQLVNKSYLDGVVIAPAYAGMQRNDFSESYNPVRIFQNQRQALGGFNYSALKGFTFVASINQGLTSFTDIGNDTTKILSAGHGLVTGDIITIVGTTGLNYVGIHTVTRFDDDYFLIPVAYAAETGGYFYKPSLLKVSAGSAGIYKINVSVTISGEHMDADYFHSIEVIKNIDFIPSLKMKLIPVNSSPPGAWDSNSRTSIVTLAVGDILWIGQINATVDYIVATEADLTLTRIDI